MLYKDREGASGCFGVARRGACCTPCGCRSGGGTATCCLVYSTMPAMSARPIPTSHPGPVCCSLRCMLEQLLEQRELSGSSRFATAVCCLLLVASQLKTVSFAAASSAFSASIFCRRASAPLRPASCFLWSFTVCFACDRVAGTVGAGRFGESATGSIVNSGGCVFNCLLRTTLPVTVFGCGQRGGEWR